MHIEYLELDGWEDNDYLRWYMRHQTDPALLYADTHAIFALEQKLITAEQFAALTL